MPSLTIPILVLKYRFRKPSVSQKAPYRCYLALLMPYPNSKPFRLLKAPFPSSLSPSPEMLPTFPHNSWISVFRFPHSSNRCPRLCRPLSRHQHWSESTQFHLSLRKGAISALLAVQRVVLRPRVRLPLFSSKMRPLCCLAAFSAAFSVRSMASPALS